MQFYHVKFPFGIFTETELTGKSDFSQINYSKNVRGASSQANAGITAQNMLMYFNKSLLLLSPEIELCIFSKVIS